MRIGNGTVEQDTGKWLILAEATRTVGTSVDTRQRRIRRGEREARQEPTRHAAAYRVRLGDVPTVVPTVGSPPMQPASVDTLELLRLVRDQQTTIMELIGRVGFLQAELMQARAQLALMAPKDPAEEALPIGDTTAESEMVTHVPDSPPRGWVARLRGALGLV